MAFPAGHGAVFLFQMAIAAPCVVGGGQVEPAGMKGRSVAFGAGCSFGTFIAADAVFVGMMAQGAVVDPCVFVVPVVKKGNFGHSGFGKGPVCKGFKGFGV